MKRFLSTVKKSCKRFMTGKSGFSLVELIVVIAIMAVMAAVLAPALLGYVERSRAQKDDSAMSEVANAIQLSLADQNVYDELLPYAVKGNFSCYADGDTSTNTDANKTITKAPDYWLFNDEARKLDETAYLPAGSMRGATVTFKPNGSAEYILKAGVVNQIGDESTKKGTNGGAVLEDCPELYNRLRSTVGDTIQVSSQTYRNSTYTIFISMGTTGGNQADKQDAIQVYGQYNGTNLPEVMTATGSATQDKGNAGSGGSEQPGGGVPAAPVELTTLTAKTWSGLTSFNGEEIWTDGKLLYHSTGTTHKYLSGSKWSGMLWSGESFNCSGCNFWTDGTNIYYSDRNNQYVLNGRSWVKKTWNSLNPNDIIYFGKMVWTDGQNVYLSRDKIQYVLQDGTWVEKTWNGLTGFYGTDIWTDGINYYCSSDSQQYVLQGDTWVEKTWNGLTSFGGYYVWTDGSNYYYSKGTEQYVLNGGTWEPKTWEGLTNFDGNNVWTDGVNYYYSSGSKQYVFS